MFTALRGFFGVGHLYGRNGFWVADFETYDAACKVARELNN